MPWPTRQSIGCTAGMWSHLPLPLGVSACQGSGTAEGPQQPAKERPVLFVPLTAVRAVTQFAEGKQPPRPVLPARLTRCNLPMAPQVAGMVPAQQPAQPAAGQHAAQWYEHAGLTRLGSHGRSVHMTYSGRNHEAMCDVQVQQASKQDLQQRMGCCAVHVHTYAASAAKCPVPTAQCEHPTSLCKLHA